MVLLSQREEREWYVISRASAVVLSDKVYANEFHLIAHIKTLSYPQLLLFLGLIKALPC